MKMLSNKRETDIRHLQSISKLCFAHLEVRILGAHRGTIAQRDSCWAWGRKESERVTVGNRWKVSKDPQGMNKPFRSSAIGHGSVMIGHAYITPMHGGTRKEQSYNGEFIAQSRSNDTKISQTSRML